MLEKSEVINFEDVNITVDRCLEILSERLRGEQNPTLVQKMLDEVSNYVDADENEIICELESNYDCIQCMHCCCYNELGEMAGDSDDGHCQDCWDMEN